MELYDAERRKYSNQRSNQTCTLFDPFNSSSSYWDTATHTACRIGQIEDKRFDLERKQPLDLLPNGIARIFVHMSDSCLKYYYYYQTNCTVLCTVYR